MSALTPEFFDTLVIVVIIIGLALAIVRLYADFSRPLPLAINDDARRTVTDGNDGFMRTEMDGNDEDTKPNAPVQ